MTGKRRSSHIARAPFAGTVAYHRRALVARLDARLRWLRANREDLLLIAGAIFILVVSPIAIIVGFAPTK